MGKRSMPHLPANEGSRLKNLRQRWERKRGWAQIPANE
jgi:hypothetical protein